MIMLQFAHAHNLFYFNFLPDAVFLKQQQLLKTHFQWSIAEYSKHLSQNYSNTRWVWSQKICGFFWKVIIHWLEETCFESFKTCLSIRIYLLLLCGMTTYKFPIRVLMPVERLFSIALCERNVWQLQTNGFAIPFQSGYQGLNYIE